MRKLRWSAAPATLLLLLLITMTGCGGAAGAPAVAPSASAPSAATVAGAPQASAGLAPATQDWERKIVRNATVTLTVADVESSLAGVRQIADDEGGLIFSSNSQYQNNVLIATVTIEVPAPAFDATMTRLRKLATRVVSETSSSEDVTEEYTDLTSQIKNLQVQEERMRALVDKAGSIDETLRVGQVLSDLQGQIEKLQGRLNFLSHHTELSTIAVNLAPPPAAVPSAENAATQPAWQPDRAADRAWTASVAILGRVGEVLITAGVFCWWLLPLTVVALLWLRARRRWTA